jgi:glycosyltransferase involved in cell wall biosynthesis
MFHGVPAIATRVGGLRYQVLDEETGYLVSVGDVNGTIEALRRLITSSALRERLGDRARQRFSQTFSPQKIVKELMETYRSCVVGARL